MKTEFLSQRVAGEAEAAAEMEVARTPATADLPVLTIEPLRGWIGINWKEIWRYREVLYFLTWRDVKIRYKQTILGASWAFIQPFLTMVVFTIFFGHLGGLGKKTGGIPYPIYVYAGLLPWTFFANSITASGNSLVRDSNLITKVYLPRLIIPLAAVGAGLVDLGVAFIVLFGMMAFYHTSLSWQLVLMPLFVLNVILIATGVGSVLSSLTATYHDFRYVVPFMVQIWMFITPVIYPPTIVPAKWRWLLFINPMTGLIEGFRDCFLAHSLDWPQIGISMAVGLVLFLGGLANFRIMEKRLADIT